MSRLPGTPLYYSLTQLAEMTGINRMAFWRRCKAGRLAYTVADDEGKRPMILIPRADVEQLLADLEANTVRGPRKPVSRARPVPMNPRYRAG